MGRRLKALLLTLLALAILWLAVKSANSATAHFQAGDRPTGWRDLFFTLSQLSIAGGMLWRAVTGRR